MKQKRMSNKKLVFYISLLFAVVISMVVLIVTLINFVKNESYEERKTHLNTTIEATSDTLNETFNSYFNYCKIFEEIVETKLVENTDVSIFMTGIKDEFSFDNMSLYLIDENGIWYQDNATGKVEGLDYYASNLPDSYCYISGNSSANGNLVVRNRLDKPITIQTDSGNANIAYCAILYDVLSVDEATASRFGDKTNTFIVDENGLMLYKRFGNGKVIAGSNTLAKLHEVTYLFSSDSEEEIYKKIKDKETVVFEFSYNGNKFFMCSAPLSINSWSIQYIVPSEYIASDSYIKRLTFYVFLIVIIFAAVLLSLLVSFIKYTNNRKTLETQTLLNEELEQVSLAKTKFLSNMSHDIRTPINGIMGMVNIALKKDSSFEKKEECLLKIEQASQHLLSLVNDVLDMSSIESGKIVINERPNNIVDLFKECMDIFSEDATKKHIAYNFVPDVFHKYLLIDDLHFKQIILNLISNSIKFTNENGRIDVSLKEVSSTEKEASYIIEVSDNGIGMKEDFLPHIFEAFAQEDGGIRTHYKGTGLGLPICKTLTELMGGNIKVSSVYNEGTTFTIFINFKISDVVIEKEEENVSGSLDNINILLVEDNELNMEIAKEILEDLNANVVTASNGKEALDIFTNGSAYQFDVILMDIMMPIMNGYEATIAIRLANKEDASNIPIIAMTANAFKEDVMKAFESGMNEHISKPIDPKQLVKAILKHVNKERKNG